MSKDTDKEFGPCPECGHIEGHDNLWPGTEDHFIRECGKCDFYCNPAFWNSMSNKKQSELDAANKAFETQRQQIMEAAATNKENHHKELEGVMQYHNAATKASSSALKIRFWVIIGLAVALAISITVNIVMVIANIGGLN